MIDGRVVRSTFGRRAPAPQPAWIERLNSSCLMAGRSHASDYQLPATSFRRMS